MQWVSKVKSILIHSNISNIRGSAHCIIRLSYKSTSLQHWKHVGPTFEPGFAKVSSNTASLAYEYSCLS